MAAGEGKRSARTWTDMLLQATKSFSEEMLGLDECPIQGSGPGPAEPGPGAYITLVGDTGSVQMGIISTQTGCKQLAGMLLGMEGDEIDELGGADMVDAYGEIINVVAGIVKQLVNESDPSFHLGLPIFINGQVCAMEHQQSIVTDIQIGDVPVHLLVLTPDAIE